METTMNPANENSIYDKLFGRLGGRLGDMVESMVKPNLAPKFGSIGYKIDKIEKNIEILEGNSVIAEADLMCENSEVVIAIDIKMNLTIDDVQDHIERINKLKKIANERNDTRKYMGAIGGMVMGDSQRNYALKQGFYLLEPSGETFNIITPANNKIREW